MGIRNDKTFEYPDIEDIQKQIRAKERHISIMNIVNIPIVVKSWHTGDSQFNMKDANGNVIIDENTGKPKKGVCSIVSCQLPGDETMYSFTTGSVPIKHQLDDIRDHFMKYHVPVKYQGFKAVIKHHGKELKMFTSKNAIEQPLREHSDMIQTLEEAGSPITAEDCKHGSCIDEETRMHMQNEDNQMTQLVGNPNDLSNDTTLPIKIRKAIRKQYKRNNNEYSD